MTLVRHGAFPPEVARLLGTHDATSGAALVMTVPGHQVPLAGGAIAAPVELWTLARTRRGLLSLVFDGLRDPAPHPAGSAEPRDPWPALASLLEIRDPPEAPIRPAIVHRTVSALVEARRFFAVGAVFIAHASWSDDAFGELQRFVALLGGRLDRPGQLAAVPAREGIDLFFGWAVAPG